MLIETWIAVLIVFFLFISNLVLVASGIANDQRLEDERKENNELIKENIELRKEVMRLNSKINLAKLYIEKEVKKQ